MIQAVFWVTLTMAVVSIDCTKPVGYIYNAKYVSSNIATITTYKNTCAECICYGFFSSVPPLYVGLNCYKNNKTCALFANYSSTSTISIDLNSTFIFIQQPPLQNTTTILSRPIGITVAGYGNGTSGTENNALDIPWGLAIGMNGSLFVSDSNNHRVMKIREGNLTGSIIVGTGVLGNSTTQLKYPTGIVIRETSNLYVNDDYNYRVMLWRENSSAGVKVVGTGVLGNTSNQISVSAGLAVDSQGNIYVADYGNHRVMKWLVNATSGTIVAGITGVEGSSNSLLNQPSGLYLDENNSYIYIADTFNHRIQRYQLGVTVNVTTVAGGNGAGSGSNQLYIPYAVYVSKKTGDIYIADTGNHRIQRWSPRATTGVTIAGITGVTGSNATLLNSPTSIILSINETFLYVSDGLNHRVQRFQLP